MPKSPNPPKRVTDWAAATRPERQRRAAEAQAASAAALNRRAPGYATVADPDGLNHKRK